jgi:hypothetical protein
MVAYVMTGSGTFRDIGNAAIWGVATARAGGDTINTNGFNLTIDQDTRYGLSGTTSTTLGNITINATKGGNLNIDATKVWLVPFNTGSGTITAGTSVTLSPATGNVIGLYSAVTAAPVLTGVATGWLKLTNVVGTIPSSGTFTQAGYTFTISGAPIRGFIEINGDEASGIIANRLGTVTIAGAWYEVGSTSGSSATTYQLPTNGSIQYFPGVYVDTDSVTITGASWSAGVATYTFAGHPFLVGDELTVTGATPSGYNVTDTPITAVTANTFSVAMAVDPTAWSTGGAAKVLEAYPCAGSLVAAASTATDALRGKVCWISTAGILRFGSDGTNTVGNVPVAGKRIRIPNILTANNTTAARTANVLPNATLATRYDFTSTGGGAVVINKANFAWYPSFVQPYSLSMTYAMVLDQLQIDEIAQYATFNRVGVGQTAAQAQFALLGTLCFAGGVFNGCVFTRATLAAASTYINSLTDMTGFTFNSCREYSFVFRANATTGAATLLRVNNCTWNNHTMGLGQHLITTCSGLTYKNTIYFDNMTTTGTTMPMSVWAVASNTNNCVFDGLTFGGGTNVQPYTAILSVNAAGCSNIKLRNIGTYAAPLSLGSTNATGLITVFAASAAASNVKVQRVYVANTRTGQLTADNSTTGVLFESVFGDYADAADVAAILNFQRKSIGGTPALTAQVAIYGTHWFDCYTSATAGRIGLLMNEASASTTAQVTLTNGAAFTAAGGLYMPTIGMTATFEIPYYLIGHTAFQNSAAIMAGGTATNYTYGFQIDKNDGAGWSTLTSGSTATTLATALNALTGIDASKGFKLRIKITTGTANTTAITSFYVLTSSTTTSQAYQYPLDTINLTLTGLQTGSDVVILAAGTSTERSSVDANATSTWTYIYATQETIDIGVFKAGYVPFYIRNYSLAASDASLPIAQVIDRAYA